MQFDRDASGKLTPLPRRRSTPARASSGSPPSSRASNNNFDTDLFAPILAEVERLSGQRYRGAMAPEDAPFRVVADHVRAATMLVADGVLPSNEGRGYVLRRILRRAMRHGRRLGLEKPFLFRLAPAVVDGFIGVYFDAGTVEAVKQTVAGVLAPEEERFGRTLSEGADRVGEAIERLRREGATALSGETVFRLYDTYGIPLDVIEEIAGDEGVAVDRAGFEEAWSDSEPPRAARRSSRRKTPRSTSVSSFRRSTPSSAAIPSRISFHSTGARILGIVRGRQGGRSLDAGETGDVVTDRTVFYRSAAARSATRGLDLAGRPGGGDGRPEAASESHRPPRSRRGGPA